MLNVSGVRYVFQGRLGDCYLLSALSVIAAHPRANELMKHIIVTDELNAAVRKTQQVYCCAQLAVKVVVLYA